MHSRRTSGIGTSRRRTARTSNFTGGSIAGMTADELNEIDLRWCDFVAASIVDELLVARLFAEDQAEWARKIVAQDVHIKLLMGIRPANASTKFK